LKYIDPDGRESRFAVLQDSLVADYERGQLTHSQLQNTLNKNSYAAATGAAIGLTIILAPEAIVWAFSNPASANQAGLVAAEFAAGGALASSAVRGSVKNAAKETNVLFRAVSKAELDDIAEYGLRTTAGGFETVKLFATTLDDATRYGKNNFRLDGIPNFLIRVDVPKSVTQIPLRLDFMDAVSIPANQLNKIKVTPVEFSPLVK
jgi:hypothetical protein